MKIQRPKSSQPIPKNAKKVFQGVMFDVYQWKQKMFDGNYKTFEKVRRPDSVNVIPVMDGKLVLTKQKQPGGKSFIGCLGGRIDKGENPLQAAKRELLEEAGLTAKKFILWEAAHITGKMDAAFYTFIAKDCKQSEEAEPDSGEKIELISVSIDEFVDLTADNNFRDTEIALKVFRSLSNRKILDKYRKIFSN